MQKTTTVATFHLALTLALAFGRSSWDSSPTRLLLESVVTTASCAIEGGYFSLHLRHNQVGQNHFQLSRMALTQSEAMVWDAFSHTSFCKFSLSTGKVQPEWLSRNRRSGNEHELLGSVAALCSAFFHPKEKTG